MKHVREPLPDVRLLRPEVSATLAAVVETATAKDLGARYVDDRELIRDLEGVLALEASRSGTADGEVTAVLDTLPPDVLRRVPLAVRRRRSVLAAVAVGIVAAVAAVVLLTLGASPDHGRARRTPPTRLEAVTVCSSCAFAYNPDGIGGNTTQDNGEAHLAVDGNPNTGWSTENYYTGQLGKPGVGIYVAAPGEVAARQLVVVTSTHGFDATIYGSRGRPDASRFGASGWVRLASEADTASTQKFRLAGGGDHSYRYYLVWITRLPPNRDYAVIDAIRLYR
jgi:serine/threonine-protein kinase